MGFLIDTSIWVDVERGSLSPADVAHFTGDEFVYISPITIAELRLGVELTSDLSIKQKRSAALERLKKKPLLRIDQSTGDIFGSIAAELKMSGRDHKFRVQNVWLASQAIQHGFKLLTQNKKDFEDIKGVDLVVAPSRK